MLNKYVSLNTVMLLLVITVSLRFIFVFWDVSFLLRMDEYIHDLFKVEALGNIHSSGDKDKDLSSRPVDVLDKDSFYMYDTSGLGKVELEIFNILKQGNENNRKEIKYLDSQKEIINEASIYVENQILELKNIRDDIQNLLKFYNNAKDEKVKSLVKIYENMKPNEAAAILSELDDALLLKVVKHMKETKSSPILAQMSPPRVREITIALMEENNNREKDLRYFCDLIISG